MNLRPNNHKRSLQRGRQFSAFQHLVVKEDWIDFEVPHPEIDTDTFLAIIAINC